MVRPLTRVALLLVLVNGSGHRESRAQPVAGPDEALAPRSELVPPARFERPGQRVLDRNRNRNPDRAQRFRNPGGVGRTLEYYPAGGRFQNEGRGAIPVPSFGDYPDFASRATQFEAEQVGIGRTGVLYRHMDTYGHPLRFWWFPGFFGGGAGAYGGGIWP